MRCANYELFVRRRVNSRVRSPYRRQKVLPAAAAVHSLSHRHAPNKKLRFLVRIFEMMQNAQRTRHVSAEGYIYCRFWHVFTQQFAVRSK